MPYYVRLLFFAIVISMLADDFQSALNIDLLSAWEQCDKHDKDSNPEQDCEEKEGKEEKKEAKKEKDDEASFDFEMLFTAGSLLAGTQFHDALPTLTGRVHEFDTPPPKI